MDDGGARRPRAMVLQRALTVLALVAWGWSTSDAWAGTRPASPSAPLGAAQPPAVHRPRPPAPVACLSAWYAGEAAWTADAGWGFRLPSGAFLPWEIPPRIDAGVDLDGGAPARPAGTARGHTPKPDEFEELEDVSALADVFAVPYVPGPIVPLDAADAGSIQEPGRARIEQLFEETYGRTRVEISSRLVKVRLFGVRYPFHERAAPALERVARRLDAAVARAPHLGAFLKSIGGTWNYRRIKRSKHLSAHAWGIAVDLNPHLGHYWRWQRRGEPLRWQNRVPQEIVDAFEAEGFVWGGRWLHYDTMHFEYRPELLSATCREAVAAGHRP